MTPHPSTFFGFALGYNPTEYTEFLKSPCTAEQNWVINKDTPLARQPCTQDLTGRPLDNAPKWSASSYASYQRPLGTLPRLGWPVIGYLWADWAYRSEVFLQQDLDPNLLQPAYGLLNLRTGLKTDDRSGDFPRIDDRRAGRKQRYLYNALARSWSFDFHGVIKYDLERNRSQHFIHGDTVVSGEHVFAPDPDGRHEDDGWLLTMATDRATETSELVVLDARDLAAGPVARVHIPFRVPVGFHGNWFPEG